MTPRERVHRSLSFDHPDRVPRDLWELPVAALKHGAEAVGRLRRRWPTDFARPDVPNVALQALREGEPTAVGTFRDEWGCRFTNLQAGVIGEVKEPLLDDWSRLDGLRLPEEALDLDFDAIHRACAASDHFMFAGCGPNPFERMQFLRGSENVYLDLAEDSPELHELLRTVHGFYCRELERWAATDVDGLMIVDDWGGQQSLLISPAQWRRVFRPIYADYVRIAHDGGKRIFMHSDGCILEIYEDLIEIGVDAINSQLFCMDIEEIGRRFRGRICFWGEIDRQRILAFAEPCEVRDAVRRVAAALYRPEGGVIAQCEMGPGAKVENVNEVFRAWEEVGMRGAVG
ncbi:MAG: methyltransferase [Phycisphaeraceae bacterium]|nr:methyltransferase [Phycisphaeraceae bacterium]